MKAGYKSGYGILSFINPHGFLDNSTFRGMRWSLINTYDDLFVFDLNGNVKKGKKGDNGEIDENVFDITTGVSINIFTFELNLNSPYAFNKKYSANAISALLKPPMSFLLLTYFPLRLNDNFW